jgi:hypothetical protein
MLCELIHLIVLFFSFSSPHPMFFVWYLADHLPLQSSRSPHTTRQLRL